MERRLKWWLTAAVVVSLAVWGAAADAGICAATNGWVPAPTLTNSNICGPGSGSNDDAAGVNAAEPSGTIWAKYDEDESASDGDLGFLFTGTKVGTWAIDTDVAAFSQYLIVLKDGVAASLQWAWFIVDTSLNTPPICLAGFELCGTWTMYGDGGIIKDISHITLYTSGEAVTEPSSLFVLGFGLLGSLWVARRGGKFGSRT